MKYYALTAIIFIGCGLYLGCGNNKAAKYSGGVLAFLAIITFYLGLL